MPERARSNKPLMSSLRLYRLIRVLAAPGDEVVPGQGIVVVEAMKMQNELKSNRTGRVLSVQAKEGVTVAAGELLATIE